jgi:hypothetical protein
MFPEIDPYEIDPDGESTHMAGRATGKPIGGILPATTRLVAAAAMPLFLRSHIPVLQEQEYACTYEGTMNFYARSPD